MRLLIIIFTAVLGRIPQSNNDTRFVHRHTCYGADDVTEAGVDTIGCAESSAVLFEHTLTPPMLWCNASHCQSRFGDSLDVHSIDCDPQRCRVLVHCDDQFTALKQAALLTFLALFGLIAAVAYINARAPQLIRHSEKTL
jgi:hypothetical protein